MKSTGEISALIAVNHCKYRNQIVLGNAFGGFSKSFARLANEKVTGIGRRIIQKSKGVGKDGKKVLDVFEVVRKEV